MGPINPPLEPGQGWGHLSEVAVGMGGAEGAPDAKSCALRVRFSPARKVHGEGWLRQTKGQLVYLEWKQRYWAKIGWFGMDEGLPSPVSGPWDRHLGWRRSTGQGWDEFVR